MRTLCSAIPATSGQSLSLMATLSATAHRVVATMKGREVKVMNIYSDTMCFDCEDAPAFEDNWLCEECIAAK